MRNMSAIYIFRRNGVGLAAIVLALLSGYVSAAYFTYSDVTELNTENFDELVVNSDGVALIHFYAPYSQQCKQLASRINAVAANLKGIALVGAVDCTAKDAEELCRKKYPTPGFPTIRLFGPDKTKNPYTGQLMKEAIDFKGDRTSKNLADAVTKLLTDVHITQIRAPADLQALADAASAAGKAQVLLFTDKDGASNLYKGLSMQMHRRGLAFGQVHSRGGGEEVVAKFGVTSFPTLVVVKADGSVEKYGGEPKAPALREFLQAFGSETAAKSASEKDASAKAGGGDKAAPWSFVRQVEGLGELDALESREDMALLALHGAAGEDGCRTAREAFLAAAGEMQAVVDTLLVSVPATDLTHGSPGAAALSRIGVDVAELADEPCELQVVLLPYGADKAESGMQLKYTGPPDGRELQRWVTGEVPSMVSELDDGSAPAFFTADPSEGAMPVAPKVLLFSSKDEAPGVFRALAVALRGRGNLAFAWVQANSPGARGVVDSFKPPKIPALMVVLPQLVPDEKDPAQSRLRFGMQPYFGPLKYSPMRAFLEHLAAEIEMTSGVVTDPELIRKTLPQITKQEEFHAYCTEPAGMCLLALLDSTAAGFEEERKSLLAAAMQHSRANSALHFAWMDALQHRSVMQAFGVLRSDLPVLVALSARRMRFGLLHSSGDSGSRGPALRPELVARFLSEVLNAKLRTEPLQALPEVREGDALGADSDAAAGGGAGAGGEDAAAAAMEEEFDLSDVLSEEVEGGGLGGAKADRLAEVEAQLKAEEEARKAAEKAAKSAGSKNKKKKKKKSKKGGESKSSSSEEL